MKIKCFVKCVWKLARKIQWQSVAQLSQPKHACKECPIGFMIWLINFWMAHWQFEEGAMGPFSKNLPLSNFCKIKKINIIYLLQSLKNSCKILLWWTPRSKHRVWVCWYSYYAFKSESEKRRSFYFFLISEFTQNAVDWIEANS